MRIVVEQSEGERPRRDLVGDWGRRGRQPWGPSSTYTSDATSSNLAPGIGRYELAPKLVATTSQTAGDSLVTPPLIDRSRTRGPSATWIELLGDPGGSVVLFHDPVVPVLRHDALDLGEEVLLVWSDHEPGAVHP